MILGFTGTRHGITMAQALELNKILFLCKEFRHGDCIGSDTMAHHQVRQFAIFYTRTIRIVIHPPSNPGQRSWCQGDEILPPKDYIPRNHDIVNASDEVLATPSGYVEELRSGTWATIRYAKEVGKPVTIIFPDGSIKKA